MGRKRLYASATERKRAQRARERAARVHQLGAPGEPVVAVVDHADPVGELAKWSRESLIVPVGHPLAGEPMEIPGFAVDWLRASWGAHESAFSSSRKNAKSAIASILVLGYLVGPLRRPGWRGAVVSISIGKANELRKQVAAIAEASGLDVRIRRSPYPGSIESSTGSFDTLSADKNAGHAAGYDLVLFDETGLTVERSRDLLAGLRSSLSARGGRIMHISVRGDSPLFKEILDNPETVAHVYAAPEDCDVDDEHAWRAANPGLGTIKSMKHMRDEAARIKFVTSDEPSFRAFELNQAISPTREMICSPSDLIDCTVPEVEYSGPAYLGFDVGEAGSGTAACCYWPRTGALRTWLAFGDVPKLKARGKRDGADYYKMQHRGELVTHPGRTVDLLTFVKMVRKDLRGVNVRQCVADTYKVGSLRDHSPWPVTLVRSGAGPDGSAAVRAFQQAVLTTTMRTVENLSLATAIKESTLRRDGNGNPAVCQSRQRGRIDVLSAAVLAVGAAAKAPRRTGGAIKSYLVEATA